MQYNETRAWKDEEYRESLEEAIESPVAELSEAELEQITGTGGYGGGGIGVGGGVEKYGVSAFGVKGNSYYCGNFSIRPRTDLNLGNRRDDEDHGDNDVKASFASVDLQNTNRRNTRNNRFDFGCSVSGGFGGFCLFGGK
ncbi:hypothetical protein KSD_12690 [Ktedonobacter sp. SOSP1-85]|uniref:mersacidin/lichenicidin family type 2 lantibiotic n=1 Tax=Ktedonobacter sp. SOSP1-85 TaxID=2778367 RepID=UPI001915D0FE|nr:mersacidin/lichenicidin family type 2 lantibiotic [Ktedonobacter sp. SOSP1-85]GHO73498.1 hypothetical protein KSD_12690 [Ktedonobacter sp. SOSP1-85]